ncbi:hypothetical protein C4546_02075 [Candidatus Parcubacteria bacterium]|jgi:hypothetical protein|nr:MAG: hypothetical protein C4546_02075 [Candidatus Parcubacteria bacterium]
MNLLNSLKSKKFLAPWGLVFGWFLFGLLFSSSANAITLSPPIMEFGVQPGQKAEVEIKLYNESKDKPEVIYINTANFTAGDEPGVPMIDLEAPKEDISTWIKYPSGPITLEPEGRYSVPITVEVPTTAYAGGHYGVVLFSNTPPEAKPENGGQIAITSNIGVLMLVRVDGPEAKESAIIKSFTAKSGKKVFNRLPVDFTTEFQNTGNIHLKPIGGITITNLFKKISATIEFNTEKGYTLPGVARVYDKEVWQKAQVAQSQGNFWNDFWTEYKNEKNNFAFGKYTAALEIKVGVQKPFNLSTTTQFWVLPYHLIIVWGLVIIILVIIIILLIQKYNRWIINKSKKTESEPNPKL